MSRALPLALAALAATSAAAEGATDAGTLFHPLDFQQHAVPEKVRLGDPFVLELRVAHPRDQRYELRPPRDLGDLELIGLERSRADQAGRAVTTFRLRMSAFQIGKQRMPDLVFDVVTPGSSGTFEARGAEVEIVSALSEEALQNGEALYDIHPPADVPVRTYRLLWVLAGLAALGGLAYLAVRWLRRPRAAAAVAALPAEPPEVRARNALDDLRVRDLPGQGRFRDFHFRLSEIVRGYLGERYGFDALECTSPELLDRLRRLHTPGLDLEAFGRQVRESDLVKFARASSTPDLCKRDLEEAYAMVRVTTVALLPPAPVPGSPPPPKDVARPVP